MAALEYGYFILGCLHECLFSPLIYRRSHASKLDSVATAFIIWCNNWCGCYFAHYMAYH